MTVRLNPYLNFRGEAREALEFYQSVFGGELAVSTYGDMQASDDPAERDKIMHGMLEAEHDLVLMAADVPNHAEHAPPAGFSISLSGDDEATLRRWWDGLSGTGTVTEPLERAPWGDTFGMCRDRFGIHWMINISAEQA